MTEKRWQEAALPRFVGVELAKENGERAPARQGLGTTIEGPQWRQSSTRITWGPSNCYVRKAQGRWVVTEVKFQPAKI